MPRRPQPLPDALGDAFHVRDAASAGVSAARLRARDLETPFRGMRTQRPRSSVTNAEPAADGPFALDRAERARVLALARAYATVMPVGVFFAGRTAAVLHGAPVPHGPELEVAVFRGTRASERRGIRARTIMPELATVAEVEGLPVASPASAWAMLGGVLGVRELVVVGDALVHVPRDRSGRHRPDRARARVDELRAAVDAGRRVGVARLRSAIGMVDTRAASPPETRFRLDAAASGLPRPELDYEVRAADGRLCGISEFAFLPERVAVELEGDHHRTSTQQWNRDIRKYRDYAAAGWEVVRLTGLDLRSRRGPAIVRDVLRRRGAR